MIRSKLIAILGLAIGIGLCSSNLAQAQWGGRGCHTPVYRTHYSVGYGPAWSGYSRGSFYGPGVFVGPPVRHGVGFYGHPGFYRTGRVVSPGPWGPGWGQTWGPGYRSGVALRVGF
jgi:hypothetical protein